MTSSNHRQDIEKLRDLIKDVKLGMLTTVDAHGHLRSRPMFTQGAEFDGNLWFLTAADSSKAEEIETEQQVNVSYSLPGKNLYLSISGAGQVVDDRAKIQSMWNPLLKAWFEGPDDPNIRLLKVSVTDAEYWDGPDGFVAKVLEFARAMKGGKVDMGKNEELKIKPS